MKLSEWARRNGVHYQTAWQWARDGKMPVPITKTETGRYLVLVPEPSVDKTTVGYCVCGRRIEVSDFVTAPVVQ